MSNSHAKQSCLQLGRYLGGRGLHGLRQGWHHPAGPTAVLFLSQVLHSRACAVRLGAALCAVSSPTCCMQDDWSLAHLFVDIVVDLLVELVVDSNSPTCRMQHDESLAHRHILVDTGVDLLVEIVVDSSGMSCRGYC